MIAAVLNISALQRERPSEIALLLGLTRFAVIGIGIGLMLTLAIGLWLVDEAGYDYGDTWIVVSLVLWVIGSLLGGRGGRREKETRLLAMRLAAEGDVPSAELRARLRDPVTLAFSYGSGLAIVAVLVLMIWKPWL